MTTRRIATLLAAGLLALGGVTACGEEDVEDAARDAGNTAEDVGNQAEDEAGELGRDLEQEIEE